MRRIWRPVGVGGGVFDADDTTHRRLNVNPLIANANRQTMRILAALAVIAGVSSTVNAALIPYVWDTAYSTRIRNFPGGATPLTISDDPIVTEGEWIFPRRVGADHGAGKATAGTSTEAALGTYADVTGAPGYGSTMYTQSNAFWRDYAVVSGYTDPLRLTFFVHAVLNVAGVGALASIKVYGGQDHQTIASPQDIGADIIGYVDPNQGLFAQYYPGHLLILPAGTRHGILIVDDIDIQDDVPFSTAVDVTLSLHMDIPPVPQNPGEYPFFIELQSQAWASGYIRSTAISNGMNTLSFAGAVNPLTGEAVPITFGSGITSAPTNGPVVPEPTSLALAGFAGLGLVARAIRRRGRAGVPPM